MQFILCLTVISKREKKDRNKTEMKAKYREAAKCDPFGIERVDAQRVLKIHGFGTPTNPSKEFVSYFASMAERNF